MIHVLEVCNGMRVLIAYMLFLGEFWPHTFFEGYIPRYHFIPYYITNDYNGTNCVAIELLVQQLQRFV